MKRGAVSVRVSLVTMLIVAPAMVVRAQTHDIHPPESVAQLGDPVVLFQTGKYEDAIKVLQAVPRSDSAWIDAQLYLTRALSELGRYDDAERIGKAAAATPDGKNLWNTYGEVLLTRGKRAAAESAFVRALALHATDSLTATLNLAIITYQRGEQKAALDAFDRFIDVYNNNSASLSSAELTDVAVAVEYLSVRNPELDKDALTAFDRATSLEPDNLDAKVLVGELFLDKYNHADAETEFEDVLRSNPRLPRALVGAARRAAADNQPGADSLVTEALKVNPDYVPSILFRAEGLIGGEDYAGAEREVQHALRVDPSSSNALALLGATQYLVRDSVGYAATRQRAMALNPHDGGFYLTLAEMVSNVRLYDASVDFARQAIAADSMNWAAYGKLGLELFHLGRVAEAKQNLDRAFKGDPYNVWIKNTLDLIDTYKNYVEIPTEHFQFFIEKDESDILGVYMGDLAERAYKTYSAQFGYQPPPPIRVEVYRTSADFSVRTLGLPGLEALGVSFGTTSAFISPAATDLGPFNWGSVMWHELAHTFTLGMTNHRIPRWFSEGISVYEEHHGRPGWGMGVTGGFLAAFKNGKLPPPSRMNDGFSHPAYPEEVQVSYYEASLFCDMIVRDYGDGGLLAMLHGYADGLSTDQVFKKVLTLDPAGVDQKFKTYIAQRFAGPLAAMVRDSTSVDPGMSNEEIIQRAATTEHDSFIAQMVAGRILLDRGDTANAVPALTHAVELFPEDAAPDSPYSFLIRVYTAQKDEPRLTAILKKFILIDGDNYDAHVALEGLLEAAHDTAGAAQVLESAMYINPFDVAMHRKLADLFHATGDKQKVIRERRAIVALKPTDLADAWYQLALAYMDASDRAHARTAVLRSLEEAPNYQLAQELLLKLHGE
jgi:cellulose synthase operon protein C